MRSVFTRFTLAILLLAPFVASARGQVSIEEAERRLKAKLATRPSTTQPGATEIERLHAENLRLRERVAALEQEVLSLKEVIAHLGRSTPGAGPATRRAVADNPDGPQKLVAGLWRGGDRTAGTGYLIQFNSDGTYKQTFISQGVNGAGQFRVSEDNTMEMWSDNWPEGKKHNQYQFTATPLQLTLTPRVLDGLEVKTPRAVVLRRAE